MAAGGDEVCAFAAATKPKNPVIDNHPMCFCILRSRIKTVMAGLDPAIHVLATGSSRTNNRMDARVKPAHDDFSGSIA